MTSRTPRRPWVATTLAVAALATAGASLVPFGSPAGATPLPNAPATLVQPSWPLMADRDSLAEQAGAAYRALAWSQMLGADVSATRFGAMLDEIAEQVALRVDVPAVELQERWAAISPQRQLALLAGLSQLGVPYRSMKSLPGQGFDCSGLTSYAWRMANLTIPRSSRDQMRAAEQRDALTAQAGDLVYFPGHVMMSLGLPGVVLHSPQTGRVVEVERLGESRSARLQYADPLA